MSAYITGKVRVQYHANDSTGRINFKVTVADSPEICYALERSEVSRVWSLPPGKSKVAVARFQGCHDGRVLQRKALAEQPEILMGFQFSFPAIVGCLPFELQELVKYGPVDFDLWFYPESQTLVVRRK